MGRNFFCFVFALLWCCHSFFIRCYRVTFLGMIHYYWGCMGLTLTRLCSCVPCGWETHFWGCCFLFFFVVWVRFQDQDLSLCSLGEVCCGHKPAVRKQPWYRARHCTLPSQPLWITQQKLNIQVNPSRVFCFILMIIIEENRDWDVWQPLKKVHFYYCSCVMWQNSALLLLCKDDSTHLPPIMTQCLK